MMEAIHRVFNNAILRKVFLHLRLLLGLAALAGLALLVERSPSEWFWPGLAVSAFGALMQWWCFSCIMTSKELAVNGPYSFVRNPMYLSRFFLVFGGVLMIGNWWVTWSLLAALVLFYHFYMVNRVKREERKLAGIFGAPYEEYCRAVPRFLPSFRKYRQGRPLFCSWTCFQRNNGLINMLATAAAYAGLWWYVFVYRAV
jgi:protein-S-isoprenylcysteine O-methyltransferase Ste14